MEWAAVLALASDSASAWDTSRDASASHQPNLASALPRSCHGLASFLPRPRTRLALKLGHLSPHLVLNLSASYRLCPASASPLPRLAWTSLQASLYFASASSRLTSSSLHLAPESPRIGRASGSPRTRLPTAAPRLALAWASVTTLALSRHATPRSGPASPRIGFVSDDARP